MDLPQIDAACMAPVPEVVMPLLDRASAVLIRNQLPAPGAFEDLTRQFCSRFHHVGTRVARRDERGDGYTTEVFSQNFRLLAHSEGAYRPHQPPPALCFFYCLVPPAAAGGETTLVDGVEMAENIPAALRTRLMEQGITYECQWGRDRWQSEFEVQSRDQLERLLASLDNVRFKVDDTDELKLFFRSEALHGDYGKPCFCNGLLTHLPEISHPAYTGTPVYSRPQNRMRFGDGTLMEEGTVNSLIDAHEVVLHRHRWQQNDLLIIDNRRVMHGREMTVEPCERVIVSRFGW